MRRIRRPLPEHDQITRIAAERDAARSALRRLQDHVRGNASVADLNERNNNSPTEGLEDEEEHIDRLVEVNTVSRRSSSAGWWGVTKILAITFAIAAGFIGLIVWAGTTFDENRQAQGQTQTQEQKLIDLTHQMTRMAKIDADIYQRTVDIESKMYELSTQARKARASMRETYNRRFNTHFTMIMDVQENSYDTNTAPQAEAIPPSVQSSAGTCTEGGIEDMRCSSIAEAKQWQLQRQENANNVITYTNSVSNNAEPQVDVRARTGDTDVGHSGSHATARRTEVPGGVLSIRTNVLQSMPVDSRTDEVPGLQREGRN